LPYRRTHLHDGSTRLVVFQLGQSWLAFHFYPRVSVGDSALSASKALNNNSSALGTSQAICADVKQHAADPFDGEEKTGSDAIAIQRDPKPDLAMKAKELSVEVDALVGETCARNGHRPGLQGSPVARTTT
jgi:hypothetical protein